VLLPKRGAIAPPVPNSPEIYARHHPDRIGKFPFKERLLIESTSPDSINRQWRHELDHDAESVFWLLLYWVVGAQPAHREKEGISAFIWASLTETVVSRTALLRSLSEEESLEQLTHSAFRPLLPWHPSLSSTDTGLTKPKCGITNNTSLKPFSA
jgi:hypothetical protein